MFKRLLLVLLGLAAIAVLGLLLLAYRPSIDTIAVPAAASFPPERIAQGEVLAAAGYCATCHTAKGGAPYAGGYPMQTEFGTLYSTNITPDAGTGIGQWSEAAFLRAMQQGVSRDGSHHFPAFPYQHFNQVSAGDIGAIYAYLMSLPPVNAPAKEPDIAFPLNLRVLQAGWKLLHFRDDAYGPVTGGSPEWNRGAYLAEGLAHCSACHSPRNGLGAELTGEAERYAGAALDGWYAPPLKAANTAAVAWSQDELFAYLRNGGTALHGVAVGPMSPVVHAGLAKLPEADVRAIAVYFADRFGPAADTATTAAIVARALASGTPVIGQPSPPGEQLYAAACGSCHFNSGPVPALLRVDLGLNSALSASDPSNLLQVILHGVGVEEGLPGVMMPGFAHALSNDQVVTLAAWLRSQRTGLAPWPDLAARVDALNPPSPPAP